MKTIIEKIEEHYDTAKEIAAHPLFARLGLGDAATATVYASGVLVLTADAILWTALQNRGVDAVNFRHVRKLGR